MVRDIPGEVKRLVGRQLHVDASRIRPGTTFGDDLGADSLALLELTLALEAEFDIEISDDDAAQIRKVADVIQLVERHVKEAGVLHRSPAS